MERQEFRANERHGLLRYSLKKALNVNSKGLTDKMMKWTYVDVGANIGTITSIVSEKSQLKTTFAVDVFSPTNFAPSQARGKNRIQYVQVSDNSKVEIPDKCADLITCFQVIHHFSDRESMLSEITRISKPGTFLFVREHDVPEKKDAKRQKLIKYLDAIHEDFGDEPSTLQYSSRESLCEELGDWGFEWLFDVDYRVRKNRQAIYFALFKKRR